MKSKKLSYFLLRYILGINTPDKLLRFLAKRDSGKVIFEQNDQQLRLSDFNSQANKLARGLQKKGLKKGDTVAIWAKNRKEFIETRLACYKLGLVFCAFIDDFDTTVAAEKLRELNCAAFIYDTRGESIAMAFISKNTPCLFITLDKAINTGTESYTSFCNACEDKEILVKNKPKEICAIGFTSGTTGKSKGVVWNNRAWISSFYHFMLNAAPVSGQMKMLQFIPLSTAGSLSILPWLASGGKLLLLEDFQVAKVTKAISEKGVTHLLAAPVFLMELCAFYKKNKFTCESLKSISVGSAALPGEKLKEAIALFGPIIIQSYGMSECLAPIASIQITNTEKQAKLLTSVGKVIAQVKLKIENKNKQGIGTISIKSNTCALGYWDKCGLNTASFSENTFYSDDLGKMDADGNLYIIDRVKDISPINQKTFYPRLAEEKLYQISGVKQACIVIRNSAAEVYISSNTLHKKDSSALEKACKEIFQAFPLPFTVHFIKNMPVSSSGKILRAQL